MGTNHVRELFSGVIYPASASVLWVGYIFGTCVATQIAVAHTLLLPAGANERVTVTL